MTYVPGPGQAGPAADAAPEIRSRKGTGGVSVLDCRCQGHPGRACWQDRHQHWALVLADAGGFVYRTATGSRLIEPGMAILTRPGEAYQCDHPFGAGDESLVVTLPEPPPLPVIGDARRVGGVFLPSVAAMARLSAAARAPALDERRLLPAIAAVLATATPLPDHEPDTDDLHSGHAVLTSLAGPAESPPSLAALGEEVGLSRFGVNRLIRRMTGLTPHQYRIRRRLDAAVRLLTTTDRSITAIASDVGWDDLSTFLNAFRQHLGCSPGQFRRQA